MNHAHNGGITYNQWLHIITLSDFVVPCETLIQLHITIVYPQCISNLCKIIWKSHFYLGLPKLLHYKVKVTALWCPQRFCNVMAKRGVHCGANLLESGVVK
jgi:hypothetical protein